MIPDPNSQDFWLYLYNQNPELFNVVKHQGHNILKIVSSKLKEKYSEIREKIKGQKLDNLIPLLHETETKKYLELKDINGDIRYATLHKFMRPDDWSIFILGQKALIEKKVLNFEEVKKIKKEAINLRGQRGLILINFILQGYFEELICPLLEYQITKLNLDSEVIKWFNNFLDSIVSFFPRAFWVSGSTTLFEIRKELIKRCVSSSFKNINIHTINDFNLNKIKKVLNEFSSDPSFPKFDFIPKQEIEGFPAYTIELKIK